MLLVFFLAGGIEESLWAERSLLLLLSREQVRLNRSETTPGKPEHSKVPWERCVCFPFLKKELMGRIIVVVVVIVIVALAKDGYFGWE